MMPSPPTLSRAPRHPAGSGSSGVTSIPPGISKRVDDIVKSPEDQREYRGLELSNRLKVLLISDPKADKAAAAFDVSVGYLSDPDELPGLAHFCEHMLFLGTKKYPEENEYSKFLSEHGGASNASTSADHTTYYFDVLPPHLPAALDVFAQFFIAPLFTPSATGRELSAVHSEHDKNVLSDTWRLDQLNKHLARPGHAYHKFGTGNKDTLDTIPKAKGIDVRAELLKFHEQWYSANIMSLAVIGKESLDELEALVVPLFSSIRDLSVAAPSWPDTPFPPERRQKMVYYVPVKDLRNLTIEFPVPDTKEQYKSAPGHYLSHLLGHEGPGSLLAALKDKGWCNSLVGGTRAGARGFAFFSVQVDLTEDGLDHVDDVIEMVFQYIALLRAEGPQRRVWDEQRELAATDFRFRDVQEPRSVVAAHVCMLQEYPMRDVLSAYYVVTEWRPELITALLQQLTPANVRVGLVAKKISDKCVLTEPWYGTKYFEEDIPIEKIERWARTTHPPSLHLPPPNEFIPASLSVLTDASTPPAILRDGPLLRAWHALDTQFRTPKAFCAVDLLSPLAYSEPLHCALTSVWALLLRDALQQTAYAAELAGLRCGVANAKYGLSITLHGFDDKLPLLLQRVLQTVLQYEVDPQRFQIMKENQIRSIRNFEAEQPYQHCVHRQALCLAEVAWSKARLLEAAEAITPEQLTDFTHRFLRRMFVEALLYGNVSRERAAEVVADLEDKIPKDATPLLAQQLLLHREIELEKGAWYLQRARSRVHATSCACVYYDCARRSPRAGAALELCAQALAEPCFTQLRTKEQLGYIVFSGPRRAAGVHGLRVLVQGSRAPAYLEERIEAFVAAAEELLTNMSEEEFLKHRSSLAAQKLEKPKRLATKASQVWSEITTQVYNFDRAQIEVEQLETITKEELIAYYKKYISPASAERRKLSVHMLPARAGDEEPEPEEEEPVEGQLDGARPVLITDLVDFKSRRRLYPHAAPFINVPRKGGKCKL